MPPKTILIADDDLALLEALAVRLRAAGYEVVVAQDAVQAVSVARQSTPDLLLLDVNMPAGSGFTILDRIQSIETLHDVPVVFLTGDQSRDLPDLARDTGAIALLYKPVETERLLATVARAVGSTDSVREQALTDLQLAADELSRTSG